MIFACTSLVPPYIVTALLANHDLVAPNFILAEGSTFPTCAAITHELNDQLLFVLRESRANKFKYRGCLSRRFCILRLSPSATLRRFERGILHFPLHNFIAQRWVTDLAIGYPNIRQTNFGNTKIYRHTQQALISQRRGLAHPARSVRAAIIVYR